MFAEAPQGGLAGASAGTAGHAARSHLRTTVDSIAVAVTKRLGPGERAELRRLRPDRPTAPSFWILLSRIVERADEPPVDHANLVDWESRWAAIFRCVADLGDLHAPGRPLGTALSEAGVSSARVVRLLRSRTPALFDDVRRTGHLLATKAVQVDLGDIAEMLRHDDGDRADRVRRKVARGYYAAEGRKESK